MAELKLVISGKDGKSYSKVVESPSSLIGRKLGETVNGDLIGLNGFELKIAGGSDNTGSPMRQGLEISGKKKIYSKAGTGINTKFKGTYIRKTVSGNTIGDKTVQINLAVLKEGKKSLNDTFSKKEETTESTEAPKESPSETPKAEAKKEVKKEDNENKNN